MDLSFLTEYINLEILAFCLFMGYMLKNAIKTDKINRFIPLIMGILGAVVAIITNVNGITLELIIAGMFSGLASTGLYEMFKNLINKEEE